MDLVKFGKRILLMLAFLPALVLWVLLAPLYQLAIYVADKLGFPGDYSWFWLGVELRKW